MKLTVLISPRNLYKSLKFIKENVMSALFTNSLLMVTRKFMPLSSVIVFVGKSVRVWLFKTNDVVS